MIKTLKIHSFSVSVLCWSIIIINETLLNSKLISRATDHVELHYINFFQARPNWRILYLYDVSIQIENKEDWRGPGDMGTMPEVTQGWSWALQWKKKIHKFVQRTANMEDWLGILWNFYRKERSQCFRTIQKYIHAKCHITHWIVWKYLQVYAASRNKICSFRGLSGVKYIFTSQASRSFKTSYFAVGLLNAAVND